MYNEHLNFLLFVQASLHTVLSAGYGSGSSCFYHFSLAFIEGELLTQNMISLPKFKSSVIYVVTQIFKKTIFIPS